jgi:hypothetical protein
LPLPGSRITAGWGCPREVTGLSSSSTPLRRLPPESRVPSCLIHSFFARSFNSAGRFSYAAHMLVAQVFPPQAGSLRASSIEAIGGTGR